jgi:hypothetical protein
VSDRDDDRPDRPRRDASSGRDGGARGERPSGRPSNGDRGARSDRPQRGERPAYGDRASSGRPTGGGDRRGGPSAGGRASSSGGRPSTGAGRPSSGGRPSNGGGRPSTGGGRPSTGGRPSSGYQGNRETPEDRDPFGLKSVRPAQEVAHVPDDVEPRDLDKVARGELKTLSKENADWVAKHLVMAGRLIEEEPEEAHKHALSAGRRAGRIGVVRETIAITAYTVGDYALTLRELRTYRRITGRDDQLPLMVDSERGLGRPERALELGRSVDVSTLAPAVRVSLAIAMSGARLDLGQPDAALGELEIPQLDRRRAFEYSPALFDAYATVLEDLGRERDAEEWRTLAERADAALEAHHGDDDRETVEVVEEELELDESWDAADESVPLEEPAADDVPQADAAPAADEAPVGDEEPVSDDERVSDDESAGDDEPVTDQEADHRG